MIGTANEVGTDASVAISREIIAEGLGKYPHPKKLNYGTAGFRSESDALHEAIFRCGILACCRSHVLNGKAVGAMITASHNPAGDNGIKLVEPDGSMLSVEWEPVATSFVNAEDDPLSELEKLVDAENVAKDGSGVVVLGRDTRDSSPVLAELFELGVKAVRGRIVHVGVVTTPQLHVAVREWNATGDCKLHNYSNDMMGALAELLGKGRIAPVLCGNLVIDCANGVGAFAIASVKGVLPSAVIINKPEDGPLNEKCGADYVQKKKVMPKVYSTNAEGDLWASLDGDADRLVFYRQKDNAGSEKAIVLADGDRFATLVSSFVSKHLAISSVTELTVGVAQTAYSNGAATEFLCSLEGLEVVIAKTGVKHLERAVRPFDIGIYWEPNGHGTILFSDKAVSTLQEKYDHLKDDESQKERQLSLKALLAVQKIANQAIGDGVADLLLVLGILTFEDMSFEDWLGIYEERCNCNRVVHVSDKGAIVTGDHDRKVEKPPALREAIESIATGEGCRAFVRPSGTEDVVRVYAEARSGCEWKAQEMALEISRAVYDLCQGVGNRP